MKILGQKVKKFNFKVWITTVLPDLNQPELAGLGALKLEAGDSVLIEQAADLPAGEVWRLLEEDGVQELPQRELESRPQLQRGIEITGRLGE